MEGARAGAWAKRGEALACMVLPSPGSSATMQPPMLWRRSKAQRTPTFWQEVRADARAHRARVQRTVALLKPHQKVEHLGRRRQLSAPAEGGL